MSSTLARCSSRSLTRAVATRKATATAAYTAGRSWRLTIAETEPGGRPIWTPGNRPWNDRPALIEGITHDLEVYGWDPAGWPAADPLPATFTVPLVRNARGHRLDPADELHHAAGIADYHLAHHAYIEAVAEATGARPREWRATEPADSAAITELLNDLARRHQGDPARPSQVYLTLKARAGPRTHRMPAPRHQSDQAVRPLGAHLAQWHHRHPLPGGQLRQRLRKDR